VIRAVLALVAAAAASAVLIGSYLALGGASYEPAAVADPCAPRVWRSPGSTAETIEQIALSTADGAACTLGVPREDLVLALASGDDLDDFAREHHVSRDATEDAIRQGLLRAVDDAEDADAIGGSLAGVMRTVARHLPIGIVLDVIHGASRLLPG
jgi:hypothetical protein